MKLKLVAELQNGTIEPYTWEHKRNGIYPRWQKPTTGELLPGGATQREFYYNELWNERAARERLKQVELNAIVSQGTLDSFCKAAWDKLGLTAMERVEDVQRQVDEHWARHTAITEREKAERAARRHDAPSWTPPWERKWPKGTKLPKNPHRVAGDDA